MHDTLDWWRRPTIWAAIVTVAAGIALCLPFLSSFFEPQSNSASAELGNTLALDGIAGDVPGIRAPSPTSATPVEAERVVVYISGAVAQPDVYELPRDARVKDVVMAAGGFAENADSEQLNLAAVIQDAQHIHVLRIGETRPSTAAATTGTQPQHSTTASTLININTASTPDLEELPGIGQAIAQRIVDHRTANGPFTSIEDLQQVKGIGPALFAKIQDRLTVGEEMR